MKDAEKFVCRPDGIHWCAACCDGRNCEAFGELADGTWGCLNHKTKPAICVQVNCLAEMGVTYEKAVEKIADLPAGEFNAELLLSSPPRGSEIEI
ncbi:MAG TPA: hypothetical protein VJ227_04035 [Patescibacteria group bacterium]|nr:hypothetical protein [Patescibacteria group bacterium]